MAAVPSAVKNSANMTKHLTQAELEARRQAEEEVLPQRQKFIIYRRFSPEN